MKINHTLEVAVKDIVKYFKGTLGDIKNREKLDNDTTIVTFKSKDILIVRADLVVNIKDEDKLTLSLDVILNGKRLLTKKLEGDEMIIMRVCQNLKHSLDHLLEGLKDGRTRNDSQEKITI